MIGHTIKILAYTFLTFLTAPLAYGDTLTSTVTSFGCADYNNGLTSDTNRPDVPADIAPSFRQKLSYYFDTNGSAGIFAPAGWACEVNALPDSYDLEVVPDPNFFENLSTPFWKQPVVFEQVFSPDGGLSQTIKFNALAVSIFPKFFVGGLDKWVGDPLRSNGSQITEADIKAMVPIGPHDKIVYLNNHMAEFITPANTNGLGTMGAGGGAMTPIFSTYGVIGIGPIEGGSPSKAEVFEFRLPPSFEFLKKPLITLAEQRLNADFPN